jgi:deazaflavin-dependent oxidoreductase (nitroreductase family)
MPIPAREVSWNETTIEDFRSHGGTITQGPLAGANLLLLTSTGARSTEPHVAPLGYTRDGERWVVVGSNSGQAHDPAWVANVRAHPDVSIEVGKETIPARARIATGAERERLWAAHKAAIPAFANYETMVERELPVVVLERI